MEEPGTSLRRVEKCERSRRSREVTHKLLLPDEASALAVLTEGVGWSYAGQTELVRGADGQWWVYLVRSEPNRVPDGDPARLRALAERHGGTYEGHDG